MPLTASERCDLLQMAREHWVQAQATSHAYEREFASAKRLSDRLKYVTIGVAIVTAGSALPAAGAREAIPWLSWLTFAAGMVTAGSAAIEKRLTPAESADQCWQRKLDLETVMANLSRLAMELASAKDFHTASELVGQQHRQILDITRKQPVIVSSGDRTEAERLVRDSTIARLMAAAAPAAPNAPEPADEADLPEDAPGVVAAYRPGQ